MGRVGILADDLTGALDAAAPYATLQKPVRVVWPDAAPKLAGSFVIDSETRHSSPRIATERVARALPALCPCDIAFKKIDSQLRGNTLAELRACCGSGLFGTIVIAPAFPEQGRVTRGGRQFLRSLNGTWSPASGDLVSHLMPSRLIGSRGELAGGGVAVCDAETDADLVHVAGSHAQLKQPVLWIGSAGLARALGGPIAGACRPAARRRLVVTGSCHPIVLQQVEVVRQTHADSVSAVTSPAGIATAVKRIGERLDQGLPALLAVAPEGNHSTFAEMLARDTFEQLTHLPPPEIVVAVGGDTLYRLCQSVGAADLAATGEWQPGIAVSAIADGLWAGVQVISKSGAFGGPGCLAGIMAQTERQA